MSVDAGHDFFSNPIGWLVRQINALGFEYLFGRYYGIYRGFVVDVADPEERGRVRVQVPSIGQRRKDDVPLNIWALPCQPGLSVGKRGGQMHGLFVPPNLGDQIWVSFESGRPELPVYMGGWLSQNNFAGDELIHQNALRKGIRTASGHYIRLSDDGDDFHVTISKGDGSGGPSGTFLTMTKDEEVIVATKNGNVIHLSEKQSNVFAPDGSHVSLGDGVATVMDSKGNFYGLQDGKFSVSCDEVVMTASKKIALVGNVDLGPGPKYESVVKGSTMALLHATHVHTSGVPGAPTTPQVTAPLVKGNGLSVSVRVS